MIKNFYILIFCSLGLFDVSANEIVIQSTSSTRDSGLYEFLLPKYPNYDQTNIKVIAVGTGQAIVNARNCDGDLLIVHDKERELEFMRQGYGIKRHSLMFNDFVIVGPSSDPAQINNSISPEDVFTSIAQSDSKFISRSDSSGTHAAEKSIWKRTQINPLSYSGQWYIQTGQGMGPSLNIAIAKNAYIFTDRSSWLKFKNKKEHRILYSDKNQLKNEYGLILINYHRCENINKVVASNLYDWLISESGKSHITAYKINGNQVFFID